MKEYQIKISDNKKAKAVSLEITGCLNVANISGIKKEIDSAIKKSKKIDLKVTNVDDADLSLIQLLVALRQQCNILKIDFSIDLDVNDETTELFKRAGFSNTFILNQN